MNSTQLAVYIFGQIIVSYIMFVFLAQCRKQMVAMAKSYSRWLFMLHYKRKKATDADCALPSKDMVTIVKGATTHFKVCQYICYSASLVMLWSCTFLGTVGWIITAAIWISLLYPQLYISAVRSAAEELDSIVSKIIGNDERFEGRYDEFIANVSNKIR